MTANALHPGVVRTSFGAEDPARIQRLLVPLLRPVMKSPAQGAATSIHLASAPELEQVSGRYFANRRPTRSSARSYDQAVAARLWEASADLVRTHRGTPCVRPPAISRQSNHSVPRTTEAAGLAVTRIRSGPPGY